MWFWVVVTANTRTTHQAPGDIGPLPFLDIYGYTIVKFLFSFSLTDFLGVPRLSSF